MQTQDKLLSPKEVSHFLGIGDSSLRKWCLALEEHGYNFMRTDQKKRLFSEKDQFVLGNFKVLVKDKNLSINNAAEILANKYAEDIDVFANGSEESRIQEQLNSMDSIPANMAQFFDEMKTEMEQLKDINRALLTKLDEQQKYIEKRDQQILEALKDSQENKQLLLEMKEEQQKQNKKSWRDWFKSK